MFGLPLRCPTCNTSRFFASGSGNYRRLLAFLLVRPFRCAHCDRHVWRFSPLSGKARPSARPRSGVVQAGKVRVRAQEPSPPQAHQESQG